MEVFAFLAKVVALCLHFNLILTHSPFFNSTSSNESLVSPGTQLVYKFTGTSVSPAWLRDQRKGASARQLASGLGNGWWDGGMILG